MVLANKAVIYLPCLFWSTTSLMELNSELVPSLVPSKELLKSRLGNNLITDINLSFLFTNPSDKGVPTDLCEIREGFLDFSGSKL